MLSLYLIALSAAYLLPGPDMALLMAQSIQRGIANALLTAIGLACARALHVLLSALGLAALLATHTLLFDAVRFLGVLYLLWMAYKMISATYNKPTRVTTTQSYLYSFSQGLLTNLLNPKALIFCALFLPQFIEQDLELFSQYLYLGSLLVILGFSFDCLYILLASQARHYLQSNLGFKLQKIIFSSVFIAAAVRLSMS
ncbi:Threonine/homoserine/homoserine lactone efflux protein [Allopseudospirillum japonicum]|uniref:Threonine/homoserine/homoserine lactone efflux protein n=1 Tax=Allopseudospirillum japonicum TaxID=64971 RepID=A0A1H6TTU4_9GAMM|nr:LysE family translocator [Allopseudospirillum japonicum]SEI83441.1 Threonine/homoserine/homoserine lactone efflux protein [Allopseudospirillum japonicum]